MTTSEQVNEIAAALAKAQGKMKNAALNKVNPHFRNRYADLAAIRDAVTPELSVNGIAATQTIGFKDDGRQFVVTRLLHTSGQWIESACAIPPPGDMQKMGSAITYARRYSLSAICGIAADEDDDGNGSPENSRQEAQPSAGSAEFAADWLALTAAAEHGRTAFEKAWEAKPAAFKNYVMEHRKDAKAALLARAKAVKP